MPSRDLVLALDLDLALFLSLDLFTLHLTLDFLLGHKIEHYHCHELWFGYCNTCTLIFSLLKLENGLKKQVRYVAVIKYGFLVLVVIFLLFTQHDFVI